MTPSQHVKEGYGGLLPTGFQGWMLKLVKLMCHTAIFSEVRLATNLIQVVFYLKVSLVPFMHQSLVTMPPPAIQGRVEDKPFCAYEINKKHPRPQIKFHFGNLVFCKMHTGGVFHFLP